MRHRGLMWFNTEVIYVIVQVFIQLDKMDYNINLHGINQSKKFRYVRQRRTKQNFTLV